MLNRRKGFTLIEILVVVAIIAILFTILLAELGVSKRRSAGVAVKEGLATFRIEAQLQARTDPDGYAHVFDAGTKAGDFLLRVVQRAIPGTTSISGCLDGTDTNLLCFAELDGNGYARAFSVDANNLLSNLNISESFCVDSTSYADSGYANPSAGGSCESS